ncbi:MAG: esterase, partial [Pseudomonadota bacterium]|nr:esterase [Pseudomonadota bacterium]
MILNAEYHASPTPVTEIPVVVLHGLFGSLSNLGMIARKLNQNHHVIQMDLRN